MRSQGGHGIEVLDVDQAADGFVVVATDEEFPQCARTFDDFIGAGAVADDVAQIHDQVVSGSGRETGLKSFEIAMNIA